MNDRLKNTGNAVMFSFIPLIACIIYAAMQGVFIWEINNYAAHLPQYNDGIFYVKQIDAIVKYGMPKGYFGYNESHAVIGTLGSWPVFLFYPYVVMGKIFGFSAMHMMVYNMFFVMLACFVFYLMAKPDILQSICLFAFMLAIPALPRYMMSCMTEALFFAGVILFAGFFVFFSKGNYGRTSLAVAYILAVFFALCRPYMLVFIIIPAYYHLKIHWIEAGISSVFSVGIFAALYVWFESPRSAKYIEQTIDTYVFTVLKEKGVIAFVKEMLYQFFKEAKYLYNDVMKKYIEVLVPYRIITILLLAFILTIIVIIIKNKSIKSDCLLASVAVLLVSAAVISALLIFYVEYTSSRHIIVIIMFAAVMAAMYMTKYKLIVLFTVLLLTFYSYVNINKADMIYLLPTSGDEFNTLPIETDAKLLEEHLLKEESQDRWDNTVIYEWNNHIMNYLYYVPSHMGINICFVNYMVDNADTLNSKYILARRKTEELKMLTDYGYEIKLECDEYILYQKDK